MQIKALPRRKSCCRFCRKSGAYALSRSVLVQKYSESFSFYFAKPINEIVGEVKSPAEIYYRDLLYFDDRREILRRFYSTDESQVRLTNYTAYYASLQDFPTPCFEHLRERKILFKRRKRKFKLNRRESPEPAGSAGLQAVIERNRNFLRRLGNPTLYLEDLYANNSGVEGPQWSSPTSERLVRRSLAVSDPRAEVHDIYDPVFSSDE